VSTRLAGTDGVSLETRKWAGVLQREGHDCFFMAGQLDTPPERSRLVPLCHFEAEAVLETTRACFGHNRRDPSITLKIEAIKHELKHELREFVKAFDLDVLIPENALAIPLNLPLGLALTEYAIESGLPMIAHHHDFFWERKRFLHNCCWDYIDKAFPPHLSSVHHVVINSSQEHQLSRRRGVSATIIPNVMDYANPPPAPDGYIDGLRKELGFKDNEKFILQPTRIIQRKGIEHAIELVRRLDIPAKLVISHASGDEGYEYYHRVIEYSSLLGVETVLCAENVGETRGTLPDGRKVYALGDLYRAADFVTYPSVKEGFGNAFLEAIYYGCPLMVNNYSIYFYDIRPKGFKTVEMDDYVAEETVVKVRELLQNPALVASVTRHNYELARRYFSYDVLSQNLGVLLVDCFGSDV
jgi:glycosyltransferase involved in cell wall biosynthesis